ncbi:hypothetical protein D9Q98_005894 [Chlorella vulgaris]|uniref:RNase III domain-containing protein n=1 Tax=Chlorella vulgaris TaxID=3077 RepID=A0A9D4TXP6_CHLVU|nr:hypothetical protein D9Q98_005894 [Chlorella vulgaris]
MARHFKLAFVVLAAMALLLPTSQARDDSGKASPALAERPVAARRLPSAQEIASLENQLGYKFTDTFTLTQALLHPSFGELNNARLSWLGDAVLGMVVSDRLYHCLPSNATTEDLHERRVAEVSRQACAIRAHKMGLDKLLVVGKGYEGQVPTQAMLAGKLLQLL